MPVRIGLPTLRDPVAVMLVRIGLPILRRSHFNAGENKIAYSA
jgi:hypothetical protein